MPLSAKLDCKQSLFSMLSHGFRESELAEKGGGGRGQTNLQVDQPKPPCSHGDPAEIHSPGLAAKLDKFPYTGVYLNTENHS